MQELENKNSFAQKSEHPVYLNAEAHSGAHIILKDTASSERELKPAETVAFNGLLSNRLLAKLPAADFKRLLPQLEPVSLATGQDLYKFGKEMDFAYFPETAVISHLYFLEDGSSTGAAIIGREGMVGLSSILEAGAPSYWAQVTVGGSAIRIEMEAVRREFARGEALQRLLLGYTNLRLMQLSQRAVCNGRHKLDERLCTWLLMIQDRTSEQQLPLTHEKIAHHLGTRRAGISTACNALRDNEIIDYHRGIICILDRHKLQAAACECYQTLAGTIEQPLN
jgi:CRP-like cAMP-binding protein